MKKVIAILMAALMCAVLFCGCSAKLELNTSVANFGDDLYVIAFRKGDTALCAAVENAIANVVANGKAAEISNKWFGENLVIFPSAAVYEEKDADGSTASLDYVKNRGKLIIGLDDTFAPMGFRDINGELVGFDVELAKEVGKILGIEIVFQPVDWTAKEFNLTEKKIDCIWNGLSKTDDRDREMTLSAAYLNNKLVIMGKDAENIKTLEDLKGCKLGIQADSSALEVVMANDIYAEIKDNLSEYPTYDEVILDIKAGRLQYMIVDEIFGNYKKINLDK